MPDLFNNSLNRLVKQFIADQSGATSIEYALLAAGIALAIIAAVSSVGAKLITKFTSIATALK